ncbi:hypothetical protein PR048_025119 [Dryococelus australis]|uniref:Peptidase aspartic putative domain-containing protein n=1 Tax=Dryococelus australis TaxID=614101 RepID=A0ABQ9GQF3_9NEOP|nr:hypothetical protein PR048_025119 [Dryococelus australis]
MIAIARAHLRLQRAENRMHRASLLADQALNNPSQQRLFQATCRNLPSIKTSNEDDHLLIEVHGDEDTSFNEVEHCKRLEKFDDAYCNRTTSQPHARVALPVIKILLFSEEIKGWLNYSNLFTTMTGDNKDLSNMEHYTNLKSSLSGELSLPMISDNFDITWNLLVKWHVKKRSSWQTIYGRTFASSCGYYRFSLIHARLVSAIIEDIAVLKALNLLVDQWNMLLLHLLEKCIDQTLRKQWEPEAHELDIPTLSDFTDFLEKHCTSSEVILGTSQKYSKPKSTNNRKVPEQYRTSLGSVFVTSLPEKCCLCKVTKDKPLCINCLQAKYQVKSCPSTKSCRFFNVLQNTMLHFPSYKPTTTVAQSAQNEAPVDTSSNEDSNHCVLPSFSKDLQLFTVMLSTAVAYVQDVYGDCLSVRVLLDFGSQANVITESCLSRLGIKCQKL